jgi:hypothetical protein
MTATTSSGGAVPSEPATPFRIEFLNARSSEFLIAELLEVFHAHAPRERYEIRIHSDREWHDFVSDVLRALEASLARSELLELRARLGDQVYTLTGPAAA